MQLTTHYHNINTITPPLFVFLIDDLYLKIWSVYVHHTWTSVIDSSQVPRRRCGVDLDFHCSWSQVGKIERNISIWQIRNHSSSSAKTSAVKLSNLSVNETWIETYWPFLYKYRHNKQKNRCSLPHICICWIHYDLNQNQLNNSLAHFVFLHTM